jgi:hypothetical protein
MWDWKKLNAIFSDYRFTEEHTVFCDFTEKLGVAVLYSGGNLFRIRHGLRAVLNEVLPYSLQENTGL